MTRHQPELRELAAGTRPLLRIVIVGHVDHGKSTLIGRLLHETGGITAAKLESLKAISARRGMPFEWSFLLDSLQAERDQGITIDTSEIRFRTTSKDIALIDAPGHVEFLRNMITGAARSDAALLLIDAAEGIREQTRRHGFLLHLLGIRQVGVIINKMDKVGYNPLVYRQIADEVGAYFADLGVTPTAFIPISARSGDGIARHSENLSWYDGPTILSLLESFVPGRANVELALRMPVQSVYKFDDRRIIAGTIETGSLSVGDEVAFQPSGKTAIVRTIESWPVRDAASQLTRIEAKTAAGITLDREIFIERGEILSALSSRPKAARRMRVRVFWLDSTPLAAGSPVTVRLATGEARARVSAIHQVIDPGNLSHRAASTAEQNDIAEIELATSTSLAADIHTVNPKTGRVVLELNGRIAGGGLVLSTGSEEVAAAVSAISPVASSVQLEEKAARYRHQGAVVWLTGLSGSGKSTIGRALEAQIFGEGGNAILLDGDTLRAGLNRDLGFTETDRSENIRRLAEVAAFLARSGVIAIASAISPFAADRVAAREIAGERFYEVHVSTPLEVCEQRDPKGLYRRARLGEISNFTGISSPYEVPVSPDLTVAAESLSADSATRSIVELLHRAGVLRRRDVSIGDAI